MKVINLKSNEARKKENFMSMVENKTPNSEIEIRKLEIRSVKVEVRKSRVDRGNKTQNCEIECLRSKV